MRGLFQKTMTSFAPISTINDLFIRVAAAGNPRAVLWQDEFGQWLPISSDQIYQRVRALAEAFLGWGTKKGDRIALICENRWEWAVTDFAALAIGAIDVPIYPTLTGEQVAGLMRDAGCRIALVSTRQAECCAGTDLVGANRNDGSRDAARRDCLQHIDGRRR
jgi:long-chain acyl-CoA synthetase